MGLLSKFKRNKKQDEDRDIILEETAREVLGIELHHTDKKDTSSMAYRKAMAALAVQVRLKDPTEREKFEEVYRRKKLEVLKMEHPEEYEKYLLQRASIQGNILENGTYEIVPIVRCKHKYMCKCSKRYN